MYFAAIVYTLAINPSLHQEVEGQGEEDGGAKETAREAEGEAKTEEMIKVQTILSP